MLDECFSNFLVSGKNEELIRNVAVITNRQQLFFVLLNPIKLMSQVEAVLVIFNVIYRFPNIRFLGSA